MIYIKDKQTNLLNSFKKQVHYSDDKYLPFTIFCVGFIKTLLAKDTFFPQTKKYI